MRRRIQQKRDEQCRGCTGRTTIANVRTCAMHVIEWMLLSPLCPHVRDTLRSGDSFICSGNVVGSADLLLCGFEQPLCGFGVNAKSEFCRVIYIHLKKQNECSDESQWTMRQAIRWPTSASEACIGSDRDWTVLWGHLYCDRRNETVMVVAKHNGKLLDRLLSPKNRWKIWENESEYVSGNERRRANVVNESIR